MVIKNRKIKKFIFGLFFLFFSFLFLKPGNYNSCQADTAQEYYYQLIQVDIEINRDSTIDVTEKQTYWLNGSFGYFYRDIELEDIDHITDIEVFNSQGQKLNKNQYSVSHKGNEESIRWDFTRRIFNNETKSWTIKYKVHGGLGFYEKWDELYWNAIFPNRDAIVKETEVLVHLPAEFKEEEIKKKLFIGELGNEIENNNYQIIDNKTISFWGNYIQPGDYLTVVVGWPKGVVKKPLLYQNQIIAWTVLLISLALPIFVFVKMYLIWLEKGKDPKIEKTIMAHYSPPEDLPPAIFGVLLDQMVHTKDITATIIDLAVRGYIRIVEEVKSFGIFKSREYILEKLKDESDLRDFEKKIIKGIFKSKKIISSDDLRNKFYKKIPGIKKSIHQEVKKTNYFKDNIQVVRKKYGKDAGKILLFSLFVFFIWILLSFMLEGGPLRYLVHFIFLEVSLIISGIIVLIFAHYMPILTEKGLETKWKLLGFKEYLQTAEKFRLGAEKLETFSKYFPYAMIFGVEKKWAQRFSEFSYQKQNWYVPSVYTVSGSRGGAPVSFNSFASSLSSFNSAISSTFTGGSGSGSGFGGGGGAGGGGGGGGGGAG
jgi:uncharacterized membrane protein YgcG